VVIGFNVVIVTSNVGGSDVIVGTYTAEGWNATDSPNAIEIPANSSSQSSGNASPYPSTVSVSGLTGTVQQVVLRLSGFSHAHPSDVSMVLVGPTGQSFAFMDQLGGSTGVTNLTLVFDDAAPNAPGGVLTTGAYRPGPSTFASVFGGTNPNGNWSLYVVDATTGNIGSVSGGWTLGLLTGVANTRVIGLSGNLAFGNVSPGASATSTLTISNTGDTPLNVSSISYPAGFSGAFAGAIPAGTSQNVTVTFAPTQLTTYGGTVTVVSDKTSGTDTISTSGTGAPGALFDFTGDRKSEILWRHATNGQVWLWPMNGAANLSENFVRRVADTVWEIRGQGDQDGDFTADILWRNKVSGGIVFWPMNGSTPVSESFVSTVDPAYDIVGTGDYNGDGKSDILWRHGANGQVWIWLMDGAAALSMVHVDTVDPLYRIDGSGDLNADGKSDIVWRNTNNGDVWVWLMDGTARLSQTMVGTVPDLDYQIVGVADHTGDGKSDILWRHTTQGHVWIWPMDGAVLVSQTFVGTVDPIYTIVGSGDYDGNGKADILWHHSTVGDVWVWLMDGATMLSQTLIGNVPDLGYQIVKWR
jgi:hypothetical protein